MCVKHAPWFVYILAESEHVELKLPSVKVIHSQVEELDVIPVRLSPFDGFRHLSGFKAQILHLHIQ